MTGQSQAAGGEAAFLAELRELRERSGRPSYKTIAALSEDLARLYPPPGGVECRFVPLSVSAISEVLAGKRKRLPSFDWVASFVLCCQRLASGIQVSQDPGTTSLPRWLDRWKAAQAGPGDAGAGGDRSLRPEPLPAYQKTFLAGHGPYGQILIDQAQAGDCDAICRVAILLATDPAHGDAAQALLLRAAGAGHARSLTLLDDNPAGLPPSAAAGCALALAQAAEATGDRDEAHAFCQAAARGRTTRRTGEPPARPDLPPAGTPAQPPWHHPHPRADTDPASRHGPAS